MHLRVIFLFLLFQSFSLFGIHSDELALEEKLKTISGISFSKVSKQGDTELLYNLLIKQPIDHLDPAKGSFLQRVQLRHKGFDQPTVIETQGYWIDYDRNEIEKIFNANNLNVEYRFYGGSKPDSIFWSFLTLEQAAADLHHINGIFRTIYNGKWISTGASKGGQTTIFYKYFYPADVDLAIPYVAPINNSLEDKRIYDFLDSVGTDECRNKIFQLQYFLLRNEDKAISELQQDKKIKSMRFEYLGNIGKAYELAVLEYSFAFWQEGNSCDAIPDTGSLEKCLKYFKKQCPIVFWSDNSINKFAPHYYQSATQTGYYSYNITPFKNVIRHYSENPSAIFPPKGVEIKYSDCSLSKSLQLWLEEKGNDFIYIYGGRDTWSACRVLVSPNVDSKSFLLSGESHSTACLKNFTKEMKQQFSEFVKSKTGITPDFNQL